jgi:hypothetical protein
MVKKLANSKLGVVRPEGFFTIESRFFRNRLVLRRSCLRNDAGVAKLSMPTYKLIERQAQSSIIDTCLKPVGRPAENIIRFKDPL